MPLTLSLTEPESGYARSLVYDPATADRVVAANQQVANNAVNGTATRKQVLDTLLDAAAVRQKLAVTDFESNKAVNAALAALPPPIDVVQEPAGK